MVSREKRKLTLLTFLVTLLFIFLTARTVWIIMGHGASSDRYDNPVVAQRVVRGTIFDRNGTILAIETPYYSLAFHLNRIDDLEKTAGAIAPIIGLESSAVLEITARHTSYALIKRRLNTTEREQIGALSLKGVVIEKRYGRQYPQVHHASNLIGFANLENDGIEGIERSFDETLSPYPGLNERITYGNDLFLTLDMNLQYMVDDAVWEMVQEHSSGNGAAILLDADSGAILASTSYPWFDPNAYSKYTDEQRRELISSQVREPGSVFKIFTLAALLDAGVVDETDRFECDGLYELVSSNGNVTEIQCVEPHGEVSPETMISKSCNGAVAHWSQRLDPELFHSYLESFGFTTAHDISLPAASSGYLAPIDAWSDRTQATLSFGQEIAVTPVQLAAAATALTGDGYLLSPYLVEKVRSHEGEMRYERKISSSDAPVIDQNTVRIITSGMELAVKEGTATPASVEGIMVGAKTGTAQVADPEGGGYLTDTYLASTLALFPLDNPKYIIYVAALAPKGGTIWGSSIAAPAISHIIEDMLRSGYLESSSMRNVEF